MPEPSSAVLIVLALRVLLVFARR
ncbi:MAG: PEP-CTERM sorting domain-containing protein [Planctomycetes bacterium]|nr:PEP-CTERM sorting domain-containing protein [Planctomycetota bacterium]